MNGAELIAQERERQIQEEGYDAAHGAGQGHALARAGVAYAIAGTGHMVDVDDDVVAWSWWPWATEAWKPSRDMVRNLVRAGALIAAAIDAHQTAAPAGDTVPDPGLMIEDAAETASDGGEL